MLWDTSHRQELRDLIGLELKLMEMYRAHVHYQSEAPAATLEFTVGDRREDGSQRQRTRIELAENFGEEYARSLLQQFRALAFLAAFRVHDMIVGWILMANGVPAAGLFRFTQKMTEWNRLGASGSLQLPPELADPVTQAAAWAIYVRLEKVRGALTHEGMVQVLSNGTIDVEDNRGKTHLVDDATQASYLRFVSMLAGELVGQRTSDAHTVNLRALDLGKLQHLHGVPGFSVTSFVYDHVIVRVPQSEARTLSPYVVEIDFGPMEAATKQGRLGNANIYSLDVVADTPTHTLTWRFPSGETPRGRTVIDERDARLIPFLSKTAR